MKVVPMIHIALSLAVFLLAGTAYGQFVNVTALNQANATTSGYLSSTDWVTFNNSSGCSGSPCVPPTRTITTTAPLAGGGDLSTNRVFSMTQAATAANGYLSSTDWNAFNNKAAKGANADITSMTAITSVTGQLNAAGLTVNGQTVNQTDALGLVLKGVNDNDAAIMLWNTFGGGEKWTFRANHNGNFEFIDTTNGQLDAVFTPSTGRMGIGSASPGSKLTVNGDIESKSTGFKFPNGTTIAGAATTSLNGYLTSTDWTTFNGRAASGANADITSLSKIGQSGILLGDSGAKTILLVAPTTITGSSYSIVFPPAVCLAGKVLQSDGAGALVCADPGVSDATVRTYLANNVTAKTSAFAYAATNQALTGNPGTIDGIDFTFGGTILLNAQTDATQNGLWNVNTGGAWTRDQVTFPDNTISCFGAIVAVDNGGTTYGNTIWFSTCDGSGTIHFVQIPTTGSTSKLISKMGACTVSSTTISTTPSNVTCTGIPASASVAVSCSGASAFSTPGGDALYARATGTANQLALNTVVANVTAMTFTCSWVQP